MSYGPAGVREPAAGSDIDIVGSELWNTWLDHVDKILSNQDYKYVDPMKKSRKITVDDSPKTLKVIDDEQPEDTELRTGKEQHDELSIVKEVK